MPRLLPDFDFETRAARHGKRRVVGVDEVGRGPLAGPVMAAAVWLDPDTVPEGLADSKTLSAARRERLHEAIHACGDVGLGTASAAEIDALNILQASHLAMRRAIAALSIPPDLLLIDGNRMPGDLPCEAECIIRGDARVRSIAAASIVAKVTRDRLMQDLAQDYPGYGWEQNAGYPTKRHKNAIADLGLTPEHRRSFKPIRNMLYLGRHEESFLTP